MTPREMLLGGVGGPWRTAPPAIIQSKFSAQLTDDLAFTSAITVGSLVVVWRAARGGAAPSSPGTLGGAAAWTTLADVLTQVSGIRLICFAKIANGTSNTIGSSDGGGEHAGGWEIGNVSSLAGLTTISKTTQATGTNFDIGALGPATLGLGLAMVVTSPPFDINPLSFTPTSGWNTDGSWTDASFGNARPSWMGSYPSIFGTVEAQVTGGSTATWGGIAVLM